MSVRRLFIVPHFHFDAVYLKTHEEYLEIGIDNILKALDLLRREKDFRFVLDQAALVKPFLERYPEEREFFKTMVDEGRLEIVCGMMVIPDVNLPGGESYIRQIEMGRAFFKREVGVDVTTAWNIDTFGHHAQIPQLMVKTGYSFYVFARIMHSDSPSEFWWEGIDGTRILAHWMPQHYIAFWPCPEDYERFKPFVMDRVDRLSSHATSENLLALNGGDFAVPEEHLARNVRRWNDEHSDVRLLISVPSDFYGKIPKDRLTVYRGEMNPVFQGCYSSRIRLKQLDRETENLLLTAEKFQAIACSLEASSKEKTHPRYSSRILEKAWEKVAFNQFHDAICGSHADKPYEAATRCYEFAQDAARTVLYESLQKIATHIDAIGDGIPLAVFNPSPWVRTDAAEVDLALPQSGIYRLELRDSKGEPVPLQISHEAWYPAGGLMRCKIAFVAREVPGLGYEVYRISGAGGDKRGQGEAASAEEISQFTEVAAGWLSGFHKGVMENDYFRLTFDLANGTLISLHDKLGSEELIDPGNPLGNVITSEQDCGDLWEYNGPCRGAAVTSTARPFPFPAPWEADFSSKYGGRGYIREGPVFSEFSVCLPWNGLEQVVRLYRTLPRLEFTTKLRNEQEWVRYRASFPTLIRGGRIVHEIPFGAQEREEGEFPAQNWVDYSDGIRGVALLNRGLPGNNVTKGIIMLSILKCTKIPNTETDAGFEKGVEHTFQYALLPHRGGWSAPNLAREGLDYNNPLIVRLIERHRGVLGSRWSFLSVSGEDAVINAVRQQDDSVVVRVFEPKGRVCAARISFAGEVSSVAEADLLGEELQRRPEPSNLAALQEGGRTIEVSLTPWEIKTLVVKLAPE